MFETCTIEETLSWDQQKWSTWLHTRAIGYLTSTHEKITRFMLPFVVNTTDNLAVQVYEQLMTFAPAASVDAALAAKDVAATWAYEDGLDQLNFCVALASLCKAPDIKRMLLQIEEKLGPNLSGPSAECLYSTISDYAFDRLHPDEIEEYVSHLVVRRGSKLPWGFACVAITKIISVEGEKALARAIGSCLPRTEDVADIEYLFDIVQERRPLQQWAAVSDSLEDPWVSKVIGHLRLLALDNDIIKFEVSGKSDDDPAEEEDVLLLNAEKDSLDALFRITRTFRDNRTYDLALEVQGDLASRRPAAALNGIPENSDD